MCGCKILGQSSYRGNIGVTDDGTQCLHRGSELITTMVGSNRTEIFSEVEENDCRNPTSFGDKAICILQVPDFLNFFPTIAMGPCAICACAFLPVENTILRPAVVPVSISPRIVARMSRTRRPVSVAN